MTISNLSPQYKLELIEKNLWNREISMSLDRLRAVKLKYYDFSGLEQNDGLIIAHELVADDIEKIFYYLWEQKFPIAKIKPTSEYLGDDLGSMEDNNSSCFNSRKIAGSTRVSLHSYGMALDINPLQNPYIRQDIIEPSAGKNYLDRNLDFPGKIEKIVKFVKENTLFKIWGGDWQEIKDYHHFEVERALAEKLADLDCEAGRKLINKHFSA